MISHRNLRDVNVLCCLLARSDGVQKIPRYKMLNVAGPLTHLANMLALVDKQFPDQREKEKFTMRSQVFVNELVPPGFMLWPADRRFWFACGVAFRLVASGWRPPQVEAVMGFVQSMYDAAQTFQLSPAPGPEVMKHLITSPEKLRGKMGLFQ